MCAAGGEGLVVVVVVAHAVLPTGGTSAWKIDMADSSCCTNCPLIAVASSSSMLEAAARLVLESSIPRGVSSKSGKAFVKRAAKQSKAKPSQGQVRRNSGGCILIVRVRKTEAAVGGLLRRSCLRAAMSRGY